MNSTRDIMALAAVLFTVALAVPATTVWQAGSRLSPRAGLFLVLSPSNANMEALASRHGGKPVGLVSAPFATLVQGNETTVEALRANGAWSILPAAGLSFLCATRFRDGST